MNLLLGLGCPDCNGTCSSPVTGLGTTVATIAFNSTPTSDWSCNDWLLWHKELVKAFKEGKFKSGIKYSEADAITNANKVFTQWWDKIVSVWSSKYWCGYSTAFYSYFKSVGLTDHISFIASIYTPIAQGTINVAQSAGNAITNTGQTVESATETAQNTANLTKWLIPAAIIAVVGGLAMYAYKHYVKGNEKIKIPKASLGGVKRKKRRTTKVIHV
jgi:hypothetical protein